MAVTVSGTSITFNDATVQSTAASTPTTLYAVGTYIIGRPQNFTNYTVNSTIAGSSLYTMSTSTIVGNYGYGPQFEQPCAVLINVGSWRCVSPCFGVPQQAYAGLWVRYA